MGWLGSTSKGEDEESARLEEYLKNSPPGNEKRIPDWTASNVKFTNVRYVPDSAVGNANAPDIPVAALRAAAEAAVRHETVMANIPPGVLTLTSGIGAYIRNPTVEQIRDVLLAISDKALSKGRFAALHLGKNTYIQTVFIFDGFRLEYSEGPRARYRAPSDSLTYQDVVEAFDSFARRNSAFKRRFKWKRLESPSTDARNYGPTEEQRKKEAAAAADAAKQRAVLSAASFIAGRRIRPRPRWNGERWENAGLLGETNGRVWAIAITALVGLIGMFVAVYYYGQSVMNP